MAAIRYYTDEHVSKAVVKGLRERGVDVSTVADAALVGAPDDAQLVHARREGRVLFTHDADFLRLHAEGSEHAGIVHGSQDLAVGDVIRGLMLIAQVLDSDEMIGHVEFL